MEMKCKHCGNDNHFYQKQSFYGSGQMYFDNKGQYLEDGTNADMHNNVRYREGQYLYCEKCDKRVIAIKDIE